MSVDRKLLVCSTRRKHSHGRSEDNGSPETSWQQTHTLELCFTQKPQKAFRLSYSSARLKPSQVTHENTHKNIIRKKSEAKPDEKLFRTKSFNSRTRVEPFSVLGVFSGKRYKSPDGTFEFRGKDPRGSASNHTSNLFASFAPLHLLCPSCYLCVLCLSTNSPE